MQRLFRRFSMFLQVAFTAREASFIFFPNLVRDLTPSKTQRAHSRITRCWNRAENAPDAAVSRKKKNNKKIKDLKLSLNKQSEVLKKIPTAELGDAVFYSQTCPAGCRSVIEFSCVTASTCIRPLDLDSGTSRCFPQLGASVYKMENQSPHQPNLKTGRSRSHLAGWSALFLDV